MSPSNDEYDLLLERLRERMMSTNRETIYEIGTGGETYYTSEHDSLHFIL